MFAKRNINIYSFPKYTKWKKVFSPKGCFPFGYNSKSWDHPVIFNFNS